MLKIDIEGNEIFDEKLSKFIAIKPVTLSLEHSLIAISKWESKYHEPFLDDKEKTKEQIDYYIKCMTINHNVDPNVYHGITQNQMQDIFEYIKDPMTATWFSDNITNNKTKGLNKRGEVITSELIYYWMAALQLPSEYEKWHLNRLLTLIQVCNIKNAPANKMSKKDILKNNDALNAARKARMHTKG